MLQTYFGIRVGSRLFGDIGAALRFGRGRSGRPLLLKGAVLDPKSFYATIRSTWGPLWGHLWITLGYFEYMRVALGYLGATFVSFWLK